MFFVVICGLGVAAYLFFYILGKQFALRDRLHASGAIVCLAGTRGKHERLDTAIKLYQQGLAPLIIMSSKFSKKVTHDYQAIDRMDIERYAAEGRIQKEDVEIACMTWDTSLGADYMKQYAVERGVPEQDILVENESLHTLENARFTLSILRERAISTSILVTSPFHQRRAYQTFLKILRPHHISIQNYAATSRYWNDFYWFFSAENIMLVVSEVKRIFRYRNQ
jgi:uncharacterized SAM-binding protein YcdF (DUF218 family)